MTTAKVFRVPMDTNGRYVRGVACGKGHGGNRHLTQSQRGVYQCCGCSQFYTVSQIERALTDADPGENMCGTLYRVEG